MKKIIIKGTWLVFHYTLFNVEGKELAFQLCLVTAEKYIKRVDTFMNCSLFTLNFLGLNEMSVLYSFWLFFFHFLIYRRNLYHLSQFNLVRMVIIEIPVMFHKMVHWKFSVYLVGIEDDKYTSNDKLAKIHKLSHENLHRWA